MCICVCRFFLFCFRYNFLKCCVRLILLVLLRSITCFFFFRPSTPLCFFHTTITTHTLPFTHGSLIQLWVQFHSTKSCMCVLSLTNLNFYTTNSIQDSIFTCFLHFALSFFFGTTLRYRWVSLCAGICTLLYFVPYFLSGFSSIIVLSLVSLAYFLPYSCNLLPVCLLNTMLSKFKWVLLMISWLFNVPRFYALFQEDKS